MVERKDCKHFYYYQKKLKDIGKSSSDIIQIPSCRIRKITVGGCRKDCRWFEPR